MKDDFDPYHKWLGIPPVEQPPNHYRLLSITLYEADPDVITHAADRQMAHLRSLQAGPHSVDSQRLLNEVSTAKLCLLNPQRRAAYDAQLRNKLSRAGSSAAAKTPAVQPPPPPPPPPPARTTVFAPAPIPSPAPAPPTRVVAPYERRNTAIEARTSHPRPQRKLQTQFIVIVAGFACIASIGFLYALSTFSATTDPPASKNATLVFPWSAEERAQIRFLSVNDHVFDLPIQENFFVTCPPGKQRLAIRRSGPFSEIELVQDLAPDERFEVRVPEWIPERRLFLAWPQGERSNAKLEIDGESDPGKGNFEILSQDPNQLSIAISATHREVRIARPGFSDWTGELTSQNDRPDFVLKPEFVPLNTIVTGLATELYEGRNFERQVASQFTNQVNGYYAFNAPTRGISPNNFSLRWAGWLKAPVAGKYTLRVLHDDGCRIWLDERLIFDGWGTNGIADCPVVLSDRPHAFRLEYMEAEGWARMQLNWIRPDSPLEHVIPASFFFRTKAAAEQATVSAALPSPCSSSDLTTKNGLRAEIFAGENFEGKIDTRIDSVIDWNEATRVSDKTPGSGFSVRWTGFLTPPRPGRYVVHVVSDDGCRLWIDDRLLIDRWQVQAERLDTDVQLGMARVPIKIEYFNHLGDSQISLRWTLPNEVLEEVIPAAALTPAEKDTVPSMVVHNDLPPNEWVDVLKLVDAREHFVSGNWNREPRGLVARGLSHSRIIVPVAPKESYEFEAEFTREEGNLDVNLFLPVAQSRCMLLMGTIAGAGLDRIGDKRAGDNSTRYDGGFRNQVRHLVQVSVRINGASCTVIVRLDDQPFLSWTGDHKLLRLNEDWLMPPPNTLGLGARSTAVFHSARLKLLSGNQVDEPTPPIDLAGKAPGEEWDGNGLGMKFCWCPAGKFTMGSPASEKYRAATERQAEFSIPKGFWLGKYEVTQREWQSVTNDDPWVRKFEAQVGPAFPATFISSGDAESMCMHLTEREHKANRLPDGWEYSLPTEAQWEYACRAGTLGRYSFGDDDAELPNYAWYERNAASVKERYAHEVGKKLANPWGLCDMHGNVSEWVRGRSMDNTGPTRGGTWSDTASLCRSASRLWIDTSTMAATRGVRLAIVPVDTQKRLFDPSDAAAVLQGRQAGLKRMLLAKLGGTATTESAVATGLKWLARNQRPDGSWSLQGPYADGGSEENAISATAMALLAFQGAGNTPTVGEFKINVAKGWNWLLKHQAKDGDFFSTGPPQQRLYTQAQCSIAICELYGMTKAPIYRQPAELTVKYASRAQDQKRGGWRYVPGEDSDTSVTGWFMTALESAKSAGLNVDGAVYDNVNKYLDSTQENGGRRYTYIPGTFVTPAVTAEGLLSRQFLGWKQNDPRLVEGLTALTTTKINYKADNADVYYWYYATRAAFNMEGAIWDDWNKVMRQEVPANQVKVGAEAGSWDPKTDKWGTAGGRFFVTCMSLYILEVYYRHLPYYSKAKFANGE